MSSNRDINNNWCSRRSVNIGVMNETRFAGLTNYYRLRWFDVFEYFNEQSLYCIIMYYKTVPDLLPAVYVPAIILNGCSRFVVFALEAVLLC